MLFFREEKLSLTLATSKNASLTSRGHWSLGHVPSQHHSSFDQVCGFCCTGVSLTKHVHQVAVAQFAPLEFLLLLASIPCLVHQQAGPQPATGQNLKATLFEEEGVVYEQKKGRGKREKITRGN